MSGFRPPFGLLVGFIILFAFAGKAHAFGAGNIASLSKVEGQNCPYSLSRRLLPGKDVMTDLRPLQGAMAILKTHF